MDGNVKAQGSLQQEVIEQIPPHKFFLIGNANEWMERARSKPIQKKLVGDLWYENEATVMFAETNAGKSIFAVQIADAISRGVEIGPLEFTSEAQPVVYFDFELNDRQFSIRYTIDGQNPYVWDDNFIRVELDPDAEYPMGNYCQYVCDQIETVMLEVNARAAIIDNITYLNDELEKSKAALPLMKQLKVIKQRNNFSFLILAHTPKRPASKPLTKNDLQGSKMIMNFVDSAFVIGESCQGPDIRYIKQLKIRNAMTKYDKDNVLVMRIEKPSNFLQFTCTGTASEMDHLEHPEPVTREKLIETVKTEYPKGKSARDIAKTLGISHTTVNRMITELDEAGELKKRGKWNIPDATTVPDVPECSTRKKDKEVETLELL